MSIFEYDEEKHLKSEREIWKQAGILEGKRAGIAEGKQAGIIEGESRLTKLLQNIVRSYIRNIIYKNKLKQRLGGCIHGEEYHLSWKQS